MRDPEIDVVDDARQVEGRASPRRATASRPRSAAAARRHALPRGGASARRSAGPGPRPTRRRANADRRAPRPRPRARCAPDPCRRCGAAASRRTGDLQRRSARSRRGGCRSGWGRSGRVSRAATYRSCRLGAMQRIVDALKQAAHYLAEHPRSAKGLQLALVVVTVAFCIWAVRHEWAKAEDRLRNAHAASLALAFVAVTVYYLVFIVGWMRMLARGGSASRIASPCSRRWSRCSPSTCPAVSGLPRRGRSRFARGAVSPTRRRFSPRSSSRPRCPRSPA